MSGAQRFIVMVRRLPWTIGTSELKEHFSKFGRVRHVSIPYNKSTGMHRGYGFVTYNSRDALKTAIATRHLLEGSYLHVHESENSTGEDFD